ncbi:MAG: right-handed parallel beta-helix repeat-containing protein [Prolixibacteraceae bacterium]|nr:right-handed parallel beta-helix repeat-containing protein [Prolixibacteraceae bacterium]
MKKIFLLFIISIFNIFGLSAKHWVYISPQGDDRNTGTKEQPLASLAGARDRVRQLRQQNILKDTVCVYVLPGAYFMKAPLTLSLQDTGTEGSPLIFTADSVTRPIFYGGLRLDKFEVVNASLWRVFIPEVARSGFNFEQVYINGQRRFRAQTPNHGEFYFVKRVEETILDNSGGGGVASKAVQKITIDPSDTGLLDSLYENGKDDALVVFYHSWNITKRQIQSVNPHNNAFYVTGKGMQSWNPINNRSRYVVENYRGALDAPGEWFLAPDGYLYYIPCQSENIGNTNCMVPVTEKFVVIEGDSNTGKRVENIRFENICFKLAGYQTPIGGNEPAQAASTVEAAVMLDYAKHIEFRNIELANTGLYAIWFRRACSDNLVQHCHLHNLGAGGVKIGETLKSTDTTVITNHITVNNNIIQHGGYVFPTAVGVIIHHASDNIITHNDIADFRYSGVSVGWVWGYAFSPSKRNKIEFNHIHHLGWGELDDMGGVYTLGQSEGTTVSNNLIHHIYSFYYGGFGLYNDEGSSYIVMGNNTVYRCGSDGYMHHYGKENIIRNNIFALNGKSQLRFAKVENHKSFSFTRNIVYLDEGKLFYTARTINPWLKAIYDIDYNCYWDTSTLYPDFNGMSFSNWQVQGKDRHSVVADPMFVDPRNYDFHFKSQMTINKMGFIPFEYTKAGVYGDQDWMKTADLDSGLLRQFDEAVVKNSWKPPQVITNVSNLSLRSQGCTLPFKVLTYGNIALPCEAATVSLECFDILGRLLVSRTGIDIASESNNVIFNNIKTAGVVIIKAICRDKGGRYMQTVSDRFSIMNR